MPFVDFDESEKTPDEPEPTPEWIGQPCPNRTGLVMVNSRPIRKTCWTNSCPRCGPWKALATSHVFEDAAPNSFLRFHDVPEDWDDRRSLMNGLAKSARKIDPEFGWGWVTHVNIEREHPGCHVHAVARGEQDVMDYLAAETEWLDPDPYVEPLLDLRGAASYMFDAILPWNSSVPALERYLDGNGRRLAHVSDGFIEGGLKAAVLAERHRSYTNLLGDVITDLRPFGERRR